MFSKIKLFIKSYELYFWLGLVVLSFGSGWYIHGVFYDADRVAQLEEAIENMGKQAEITEAKAAAFEKQLAAQKVGNNQLNNEIRNETNKPDYNCAIPADGVRLYRKALAAK